jgi:opacity protein-like surface antigen
MTTTAIKSNSNINMQIAAALLTAMMIGFSVHAQEPSAASDKASKVKASSADVKGESAAETEKPGKEREKVWRRPMIGTLYAIGGISFPDTDALNARFDAAGYSKWDKVVANLGFGFTHRTGRLVGGFDWNWAFTSDFESVSDASRMNVKSRYWLFNYGFDVVQWKGLSVYPYLGIGAGHMEISISEEQGASFDDVLQNPGRGVVMNQTSLVLSASLGIDYRFKIKESKKKTSFFTVGLRAGYLFQPHAGAWETTSAEIYSGPEKGLQGPVVQLLLGISGSRKRK